MASAPKTDGSSSTREPLDRRRRQRFEADLRSALEAIVRAHPWLAVSELDQSAVRTALRLRALGAPSVMAIGARPGVGPIDPDVPLVSLGLPTSGSVVADMRTAAAGLADPPPEALAAIDRWDPDHAARSIGGLTAEAGLLAGRRAFGARPGSWIDWEDKLAIEELWRTAGIPVAPSAQVDADDPAAIMRCHRQLATAGGTVWAGDNTSGWHGGAEGTFWVPGEELVEATAERLAGFRRLRIMPFVEGVPCSIHGMVVPTGRDRSVTIVFRPMELMMLRDPVRYRFVYGRASSHWDPAPSDRAAMIDVARVVGDELLRRVDYRGVYTVDGVLGRSGFVPTEVNTRYGAALPAEMATVDGPPLDLFVINQALVENRIDGLDPELLERWVLDNLDGTRRASGFVDIAAAPDRERRIDLHRAVDGSLTVSDPADGDFGTARGRGDETAGGPGDQLVAEVRWGSARGGGTLAVTGGPAIPTGPQTAPLMVEVIEAAQRHWGLAVRPLVAAQSVR